VNSSSSGTSGLFGRFVPKLRAHMDRKAALDKSARLYGSDPETGLLPKSKAMTSGQRAFRRAQAGNM
jgi:hypothetical protein